MMNQLFTFQGKLKQRDYLTLVLTVFVTMLALSSITFFSSFTSLFSHFESIPYYAFAATGLSFLILAIGFVIKILAVIKRVRDIRGESPDDPLYFLIAIAVALIPVVNFVALIGLAFVPTGYLEGKELFKA